MSQPSADNDTTTQRTGNVPPREVPLPTLDQFSAFHNFRTSLRRDSSDLIQQLRFVHFTLLLSCLGLLIAVTQDRTNDAREALGDVKNILQIPNLWGQAFLDSVASRTVNSTDIMHPLKNPFYVKPEKGVDVTSPVYQGVEVDNAYLYSANIRGTISANGGGASQTVQHGIHTASGVPHIRTLSDFKKLWNALAEDSFLAIPKALHARATNFDGGIAVGTTHVFRSVAEPGATGPVWKGVLQEYSQQEAQQLKKQPELDELCVIRFPPTFYIPGDYDYSNPIPAELRYNRFALLPVKCEQKTVDLQAELIAALPPHAGWIRGSFETSFPVLNRLTQRIQDVPLTNLRDHLDEEKQRAGERFEFLGVKLPAETLTLWGAVAVLGLQSYLLLHLLTLHEWIRPGDKAWDIAWIGLYRNVWAAGVSLLSAVLVPVFTCAWLTKSGDWPMSGIAIVCGSLVIAALTGRCLWLLKSVRPTPQT